MVYTTPRTWVTGELVTAAMLNEQIRDNENAIVPNGAGAWTAYTPTLTQSGAVTKTVTSARYMKVGRMVTAVVYLTCTGSGTASNPVLIGLPVAAAAINLRVGVGQIVDASAGFVAYNGIAEILTTTTVRLWPASTDSGDVLGNVVFTAALANNDQVHISVTYEAAS